MFAVKKKKTTTKKTGSHCQNNVAPRVSGDLYSTDWQSDGTALFQSVKLPFGLSVLNRNENGTVGNREPAVVLPRFSIS